MARFADKEAWLDEVLQPEHYLLQFVYYCCCDDETLVQCMAMDRTRLRMICTQLPLLPYFLFGHPGMMKTFDPRTIVDPRSGFSILRMPDVLRSQTQAHDFGMIVNFLCGLAPLPRERLEADHRILQLINFLGGCPLLEDLFSKPLMPNEDTKQEYEWRMENLEEAGEDNFREILNDYVNDGWEMVSRPVFGVHDGVYNLVFRKKKKGCAEE